MCCFNRFVTTNAWAIPTIMQITKIVCGLLNMYNVYRNEITAYVLRNCQYRQYTFVFRKRTAFVRRIVNTSQVFTKKETQQKLFFINEHFQMKRLKVTGKFRIIINRVKTRCRQINVVKFLT